MKNYIQNNFKHSQTPPLGGWGAYFTIQLQNWDLAKSNYEALKQAKTKELNVNGAKFKVQYNPARIVSSGAKVDAKSIQDRKCFLCAENRPKEQMELPPTPLKGEIEGHSISSESDEVLHAQKFPLQSLSRTYFGRVRGQSTILVNPFPIFPKHFTIPDVEHVPQLILGRFGDMLALAEYMDDYVIFYNGPKCGASAPDHAHFQAGNKGFLPMEKEWRNHISKKIEDNLFIINYGFSAFVIEAQMPPNPPKGGQAPQKGEYSEGAISKEIVISLFEKIYKLLPIKENDDEPMMNILTWYDQTSETPPLGGWGAGKFVSIIIPRTKHRPSCYFAEGDENILISPASVDLGGVFITPLEKDFEKITAEDAAEILGEVCMNEKEIGLLALPLSPDKEKF